MKILACAYSCLRDPDQRYGDGGEGFLGWNIVTQLARFHQVHVLTYAKNKSQIEEKLIQNPVPNVRFYYLDIPWLNFLQKMGGGIQIYAYFWQIKAYFVAKHLHAQHQFDAFHHITYANDWMASFIGALLPLPYVRGPGGGAHKIPKAFLADYSLWARFKEYFRSFGQWVFRHDPFFIMGQSRAKAILVCNREAFDAIPKKWQGKVKFFPVNGISEQDLHELYPNHSTFTFITAGKLLKLKNFPLAIEAFAQFRKKKQAGELVIIGTGPELENLKQLAKNLDIESYVTFKPWMPHELLLQEISAGDVFVFPSLRDGGGAVVIEAMAQAKPIICFDLAGPGFHVTPECGIKIQPTNPEKSVADMAFAMERLYDDEKLREHMGEASYERASTMYTWNHLGNSLETIYEQARIGI
jgi:glycosyltransferase involved in cell wall biosynthesis